MGAGDQGPEPTGWELMRGLVEVKEAIGKLGTDFVSQGVYASDKVGNDARHQRSEDAIAELRTDAVDADKQRRTSRLAIALSIASFVGSVVLLLLSKVIP